MQRVDELLSKMGLTAAMAERVASVPLVREVWTVMEYSYSSTTRTFVRVLDF